MKSALVLALLLLNVPVFVSTANGTGGDAKTVGSLRILEREWSLAELNGNTAFLKTLLDNGYRSVDANGKIKSKAALIDRAQHRTPGTVSNAQYAKMMKNVASEYRIDGSTGVVVHYLRRRGEDRGITGVDVFSFDGKRWHALYSQHTAVR